MEILAAAAAALLGPFVKELLTAGGEAVEEAAGQSGETLKAVAARLWRRITRTGEDDPVREAAEATAAEPASTSADEPLKSAIEVVLSGLSSAEIAEITTLLREAEQHGGPTLNSGSVSQEVRGSGNIVVGNNAGEINIGRAP